MTKLMASTSVSTQTSLEDRIKADFRVFLYIVWKHLNLPDPTPVQYDIAYQLQHGPRRLVIEAFRGIGKSWITSAYVLWLLYCNPQLNILVVSASKERADAFSTFTKRLIEEMPILAHLIPAPGQRSSNIAFDVAPAGASHAPSVKSAGIFGQIVGSRADVIIADDIEITSNSATQPMRDKLVETVKEFISIIKPTDEAKIIFLGTPQTENTVYTEQEKAGYSIMVWPARYPSGKQLAAYGPRLASKIVEAMEHDPSLSAAHGGRGAPTDPMRFDHDELLQREAFIGRSTFALQFMLDTSLADADRYPLKLSDLIVTDVSPKSAPVSFAWGTSKELVIDDVPNVGFQGDRLHRPFHVDRENWKDYQAIIMTVDPSGRGKDEMAYAVLAYLYGFIFLIDCGGMPGGYAPENLTKLAQVAKLHNVQKIITEPNFGDGMFDQLLRPVLLQHYPCMIEPGAWANTQKELRIIDTLEPVMNQHRLIVDRSLIRRDYDSTSHYPAESQSVYRLLYQLTRITKQKGSLRHDDRLDALAMGVAYFTELMSRDSSKSHADHQDHLLRQEIAKFKKNFVHPKTRNGNSGARQGSRNRGLAAR